MQHHTKFVLGLLHLVGQSISRSQWALFLKFILCIYWVFIAVCRLSLGAVSRLLTAVASSLIAKHRLQGVRASVVVHRLSCPRYVGSFQTRDRTPVPCLGRQIVNHWNSREAFPVGS